MTSYDDFSYGASAPTQAWSYEQGATPAPASAQERRDDERRETNIVGAVLATIGLVTAVLCALAYGDVISLDSRYTVPGILLGIGATAVVAGALGLVYGRRR